MAEACEECLATELGWLPEEDYPLPTTPEAPEPIYCVGGVPVVTPHKGMVGPLFGTLVVAPPTLEASGSLTGVNSPLSWTNDTARTVQLLVFLQGQIQFVGSEGVEWTFTYGYTYSISSPALAGTEQTICITNITFSDTRNLGFPATGFTVDSGGSIVLTPFIDYDADGIDPGVSAVSAANLVIAAIGGAA